MRYHLPTGSMRIVDYAGITESACSVRSRLIFDRRALTSETQTVCSTNSDIKTVVLSSFNHPVTNAQLSITPDGRMGSSTSLWLWISRQSSTDVFIFRRKAGSTFHRALSSRRGATDRPEPRRVTHFPMPSNNLYR